MLQNIGCIIQKEEKTHIAVDTVHTCSAYMTHTDQSQPSHHEK